MPKSGHSWAERFALGCVEDDISFARSGPSVAPRLIGNSEGSTNYGLHVRFETAKGRGVTPFSVNEVGGRDRQQWCSAASNVLRKRHE